MPNWKKVVVSGSDAALSSLNVTGTVTAGTFAGLISQSNQITHSATFGYVANQHIDHTNVSITAGSGLTGGGDISATRTLTVDTSSAHFTGGVKSKLNTDQVLSGSVSSPSQGNVTVGGFSTVSLGLRTSDSPTFAGVTATSFTSSISNAIGFRGTSSRAVIGEKVDVISGGSTTGLGIYSGSFSGSFIGLNQTSGTVTSVGLSLPNIFTVTNSPVTSTGTLTGALASQTANTVFAAPNGSNGTPTFRSLVAADIPTLNQNTTGQAGSVANAVTFNNGGSGDASGTTYNGSAAKTISYNTVGAAASNQTMYIGTTAVAINRASAVQTLTGLAVMDANSTRIINPEGAAYVTSTSTITGAWKIKLPTAKNNSSTMMRMTVKLYQYSTGTSITWELGGYNYGGGNWYNLFATQLGDSVSSGYNIRFGYDGTGDCIWIGETNSSWQYPQISVTDFQMGYSGYDSTWASGWSLTPVTSFDTVEQTYTAASVLTKNNDGAGSGFDADLLDGQHGSYYAAASSLSSYALTNQTMYIGTTAVTINRSSGTQTLTGVSIDGNAATVANLTPTTVGGNLLTLANPGAIGFIRINADNTVSALNGAGFRSAINAAATNQTMYIGTTAVTIDRASAALSLTGVSIDGNAATATKLATARAINGVNFDGTAAITITDDTKLPLAGGTMTAGLLFNSTATSGPGNSTPTALSYGRLQGYGDFYINADTDGSQTEYVYITAGYAQGSTNGLRIGYADNSLTWKGNAVWNASNFNPSGKANTDQTFYIGTTQIAINRTSAAQTLTGVSIDGNAATVTNGLTTSNYTSYTLPIGGSWYGSGLPGTRWNGMSVNGGEIVFGQDLPNAGQMGILIDGCYIAAENNGFWSLASNNTWGSRRGFYWDGSYLNFTTNSPSVKFNGNLLLTAGGYGSNAWGGSSANSPGRVFSPGGAAASWDDTVTGAIKIRLPFLTNDSMWHFTVKIYNYAQRTIHEYSVASYAYSSGAYNYAATCKNDINSPVHNVRIGNDGSYSCVWIGETNTSWSYPVVAVTDVFAGFRNCSADILDDGWDVSYVTSFGTVGVTIYPGSNTGNTYAYSYRGNSNVSGTGAASYHPDGIYSTGTNWLYGAINLNGNNINSGGTVYMNNWFRSTGDTGWYSETYGGGIRMTDSTWIRTYGGKQFYCDSLIRAQGSFRVGNEYSQWVPYGTYSAYLTQMAYISFDWDANYNSYSNHGIASTDKNGSFTDDMSINSYSDVNIRLDSNNNDSTGYLRIHNNSATDNTFAYIGYNGSAYEAYFTGTLYATGDIIAYYSDSRLKKDVVTIDSALDKIKQIRGVYYTTNELYTTLQKDTVKQSEQRQLGVLAQEIQKVLPELVELAPFDRNEDGTSKSGENYLTVKYDRLIPVLIEAIKEQQNKIETLENQISILSNKE